MAETREGLEADLLKAEQCLRIDVVMPHAGAEMQAGYGQTMRLNALQEPDGLTGGDRVASRDRGCHRLVRRTK